MFSLPYIVNDFPNHEKIKRKLLGLIAIERSETISIPGEHITKSDWNFPSNLKDYAKFIIPQIQDCVSDIFSSMNYASYSMGNIWFQQYDTSDHHAWHRHPNTDWNFVYYVELPVDGPPTEFRNPLDINDTFLPDVREGQYILFPSILEHRSNANMSKDRKTIIAANFKMKSSYNNAG